VLWFLVVFSSL